MRDNRKIGGGHELGAAGPWCGPTPGGTGIATENVKRAVAMNNRQCLNSMADYVCVFEKGREYCKYGK
jgi:hypothetical protein